MLDALASLLRSIGQTLSTWSMVGLLGNVVARVADDFKRNRATEKRLKQAAAEEWKNGR